MTLEDYLGNLGLEEYAPLFSQEKITLSSLEHLDESDFKDLGLPLGPRRVLLSALGKRPATVRPASEPDAGVTIIESLGESQDQTFLEGSSPTQPTKTDASSTSSIQQVAGITSLKRIPVSSGEADLFEGTWQGRKVALKWFRYGITPKADLMESIKKLDRKCVVEVLETGVFEERSYEIMEFIEHGNLGQWIKMGVAESRVREVVEELSNAVEELHRHNIIHRDIKPSNILVRSLNPLSLVLTDFGISSLTELSLHQTTANRTVAYSAPEAQSGVISKASDWWSVGVVLLELLTGRGAFDGMDERTINFTLATKGIEIPETLAEPWQNLLAGLLAQDDSKRWGSSQLRDWMAGRELPPPPRSSQATAHATGGTTTNPGGESQAAVPYRFKGEPYYTAPALARALAQNWDEGLKHYGRGLILDWVKNEMKDAEKVVQISDLTENENLTPEMKFAVVPLILDNSLPLSWKGEIIDEGFAQSHGELLWEMTDVGVLEVLGSLGIRHECLAMVAERKKSYLETIAGEVAERKKYNELHCIKAGEELSHDEDLVKKIIGAPEEKLGEQALERAKSFYITLQADQTLPYWTKQLPDMTEWLPATALTTGESLALISAKLPTREKIQTGEVSFFTLAKGKVYQWCQSQAQGGAAFWQSILAWMHIIGWNAIQDDAIAEEWCRKSAQQGNANGQWLLGWLYENGRGVTQDEAQAASWYGEAANQGHANAQYLLGQMFLDGRGVEANDAYAFGWFHAAAEKEQASAQECLGWMYENGRGVEQDDVQAAGWYYQAAQRGRAYAQYALGAMYESGRGVDQDHASAVEWYSKAADQLAADSNYRWGWKYETAYGVERNDIKTVERYRSAAKRGNVESQSCLGIMYATGGGVVENDDEAIRSFLNAAEPQSFQWLLEAANQGHAEAQNLLGEACINGNGIANDHGEAFKWYLKAAEQGHAGAQRSIGRAYSNGWGVTEDEGQAFKWYLKAAEQGHADAQLSLAEAYSSGKGVVEDERQAAKWFLKAAEQEDGDAFFIGTQYRYGGGTTRKPAEAVRWYRKGAEHGCRNSAKSLGEMYQKGEGVVQDDEQAVRWYLEAAELGHPNAIEKVNALLAKS